MAKIKDLVDQRYRLLGSSDEGNMAQLFEARDELDGERCVVKVLPTVLADEEQLRARFEQEQTILDQLGGDGAPQLRDTGFTDRGERYFVMELLQGQSLRQLIQREGPLPLELVVLAVKRIAESLDRLHSRGVLHRDLKPEHVFFDSADAVRLVDFGISKQIGASAGVKTHAEGLIGSPWYMAPERAGDGVEDPRADVYALAVVAFEALSDTLPFYGGSITDTLRRVFFEPPPSVCTLRPELPEAVDHALTIALNKDPERRFRSAGAFANAFNAAANLETTSLAGLRLPHPPADEVPTFGLAERRATDLLEEVVPLGLGGHALQLATTAVVGGVLGWIMLLVTGG